MKHSAWLWALAVLALTLGGCGSANLALAVRGSPGCTPRIFTHSLPNQDRSLDGLPFAFRYAACSSGWAMADSPGSMAQDSGVAIFRDRTNSWRFLQIDDGFDLAGDAATVRMPLGDLQSIERQLGWKVSRSEPSTACTNANLLSMAPNAKEFDVRGSKLSHDCYQSYAVLVDYYLEGGPGIVTAGVDSEDVFKANGPEWIYLGSTYGVCHTSQFVPVSVTLQWAYDLYYDVANGNCTV